MSNLWKNLAVRCRQRIGSPIRHFGWISVATVALLAVAPLARAQQATGSTGGGPAVSYTSVSEVNGILANVKQTSASIQSDLDKTRIEKWKTDGTTKRQTQANVDSIRRNLESAMPEILTQLNNSPEDLAASFRLYRNLDALYDVFGSVVESAGAFGPKDEVQSLTNDMNGLDSARRTLGERMQKLASAKEDELGRLRAQVKTLSAAPPPPPKKVIIDDTQPAPKKPAKKKTTKPSTTTPPAPTPNPAPSK
jgi:hypothetical protein